MLLSEVCGHRLGMEVSVVRHLWLWQSDDLYFSEGSGCAEVANTASQGTV